MDGSSKSDSVLSRFLKRTFYPEGIKCIVCGAELSEDTRYGLCPNCKLEFNETFCEICGKPVPVQNRICDQCKDLTHEFDKARSSTVYTDNAAKLVKRLKYGDARYLARYMAEFMADTYFASDIGSDIVTCVPMHRRHLRGRGYNQSELLAREISNRIGLPFETLLVKIVNTPSLVGLDRNARIQIVKGSMAFTEAADLTGKRVLVIDDVITTGSTAGECARVLKHNGAAGVFVLTFASGMNKPKLV